MKSYIFTLNLFMDFVASRNVKHVSEQLIEDNL